MAAYQPDTDPDIAEAQKALEVNRMRLQSGTRAIHAAAAAALATTPLQPAKFPVVVVMSSAPATPAEPSMNDTVVVKQRKTEEILRASRETGRPAQTRLLTACDDALISAAEITATNLQRPVVCPPRPTRVLPSTRETSGGGS